MLTPEIIAKMLDHSTLQPFLTEEDIRKGCDIAKQYKTASVCARPGDMHIVAPALKGTGIKVCTVIGFPHGAHRTDVKIYEAERALDDGCEELDMVLNIGWMKAGQYDRVEAEIRAIVALAHARRAIVKVILETCYLDEAQKIAACQICERAGADFVKTSTGYGSGGATIEDLALMRANVSARVQVKASGGIRTLDQVLSARAVGATRCGVSATQAIMEEAERRYAEGTLKEVDQAAALGKAGY